MDEKYDLDEIRSFWTTQAQTYKRSASASWSDHCALDLEIRELIARLRDGDIVLDVGCANGHSTLQLALRKHINIKGIDYVPEMIDEARNQLGELPPNLRSHVEFCLGNITALNEPENRYDKVIVVRVLINLGSWDNQKRALDQCVSVIKPGGLLLLSEATIQGWKRLNSFRTEWSLPEIPVPAFNCYLDEDRVIEHVQNNLTFCELVNFSSTYFVLTRVIKPLLIKAAAPSLNAANPDMEWNRFAAQLPAWGDFGTQKLFVFRKETC